MVFTILDILQLKKNGGRKTINSVNPLYLHINHASGYIEEINRDKYLVFDSIDKNKELLKKYIDVFNGIIDKIKKISNNKCIMKKTI